MNQAKSTMDANPHPTAITRHSDEGGKITVIPAQAGIQYVFSSQTGIARFWIPAFAGMTKWK
jgi:hypothetical protein